MAVLSFVLAILAMLFAVGGVLGSVVPYVGVVCSALAVLCSVAGVVTGSIAHSRAKNESGETTFPVVAIVSNVFVFLGSLCVLATCGTCNAAITQGGYTRSYPVAGPDGSVRMMIVAPDGGISYEDMPERIAPAPFGADEPPPPPPPAAPAVPVDPGSPPPAYPPPPIDPASP